jgi:hypothetical protein
LMQTIKIYFNRGPFYNAFTGTCGCFKTAAIS